MVLRGSLGKLLAPAALVCLARYGPTVSKLPLRVPTRSLGTMRSLQHASRGEVQEPGYVGAKASEEEPWTVRVSDEEGLLGQLSAVTIAKAAASIQTAGFVVLRGASVLRAHELRAAQEEADEALFQVKMTTKGLGCLEAERQVCCAACKSTTTTVSGAFLRTHRTRATGSLGALTAVVLSLGHHAAALLYRCTAGEAVPKPAPAAGNLFRFQEASSFSSGRLDMTFSEEAKSSGPLAARQDLLRLCEVLFDTDCQLASRGAFWNFPGSGREHWHRDGLMPLLTVVTAARQYPDNAGFMRLQPFTQLGAIDEDSESDREPKAAAGESERVAAALRPGELLLFLYSAKHAAIPNFSDFDRCLLYSVYGPKGISDDLNIKSTAPSLFSTSKSKSSMLALMAKSLN